MDLTVYSDGSRNTAGQAGAGFYVVRGPDGAPIARGQIPLGDTAEVFDAEITGAVAGLRVALASPLAKFATDVTICLDNEEAALCLHSNRPTPTSFAALVEFTQLKEAWRTRDRGTYTASPPGAVAVRWCPGHAGIAGNETADRLAKAACDLDPETSLPLTIARAKTRLKQTYREAAQQFWAESAPSRYRLFKITFPDRAPAELSLPRSILGRLLAARSGHGDYACYHARFLHEDARLECSCGREKAPEHFLHCPLTDPPRGPKRAPPDRTLRWFLGTVKGAVAFAAWCKSSGFFLRTCPSH